MSACVQFITRNKKKHTTNLTISSFAFLSRWLCEISDIEDSEQQWCAHIGTYVYMHHAIAIAVAVDEQSSLFITSVYWLVKLLPLWFSLLIVRTHKYRRIDFGLISYHNVFNRVFRFYFYTQIYLLSFICAKVTLSSSNLSELWRRVNVLRIKNHYRVNGTLCFCFLYYTLSKWRSSLCFFEFQPWPPLFV